jgi:hypothetical protein
VMVPRRSARSPVTLAASVDNVVLVQMDTGASTSAPRMPPSAMGILQGFQHGWLALFDRADWIRDRSGARHERLFEIDGGTVMQV